MTTLNTTYTIIRWYDLALAMLGLVLVIGGLFSTVDDLPTPVDVVVDTLDHPFAPTPPVSEPTPTRALPNV